MYIFIFEVLQYCIWLLQWEKPEEMVVFERQQHNQQKPTIQLPQTQLQPMQQQPQQQPQTQLQPIQQRPQQVNQQYQGQQLHQHIYSSLVGFVFMLVTFK